LAAGLDALGSTLESRFEQWRRAIEQMDAGSLNFGQARANSVQEATVPPVNGVRKEP
jgi:hypothetical protein